VSFKTYTFVSDIANNNVANTGDTIKGNVMWIGIGIGIAVLVLAIAVGVFLLWSGMFVVYHSIYRD